MWTAQIYQINKDEGQPTAVVLFTDNVKYKRLETIPLQGLTASSFRARVEAMRKGFEESYTFIDSVNPKTFDLTPLPVTPPVEDSLNHKRMSLGSLLNDKTIGLIDQATYDQQVAEIVNSK
jgi:hypothetical protein